MYKHLSLILILIFLLSSQIKAQVEISKDRIVNSIKNNLHFSTAFPKSQQWREQYIDNLDIESLVDSVVSKPLVINSPEHIDRILENRIFITSDNKEYHSLIIKIAISDFILYVDQCNNTPLPDEKEKATILRDIEKIAETMNKSITLHLGGVISKNIIDSNIHDFEVILKNMIDDKLQPSLKKTMKGEEITHILQVFEGRLEKTKHRAFNRISAAKEENKVGEEALIIYELIEPVAKQIKHKTRVIDFDNFDANSIVPEYSSFHKRKNEIGRAIRQKRAAEKERKRQMEIMEILERQLKSKSPLTTH